MRFPLHDFLCWSVLKQAALIVAAPFWISSMVQGQAISTQSLSVRQPNIVLIIADDLGYGELNLDTRTDIPTPNLNSLALAGARCTQAYVTAPNCSPSRAGLFTGRTPTLFGYEFNPIGARNEDEGTGLPRNEITIAELLHDAGYTTGLIGKWHLGGRADYHPQRHGFDEFFGFLHEGHYFAPSPWSDTTTMLRKRVLPPGSGTRHQVSPTLFYSSHMGHNEPAYDANNPVLRGGEPVSEPEYLTDALTREAVEFIARYKSTPFFLCVTYNAVHSPLQAKQSTFEELEAIEDTQRRIFASMLVDLDIGVGQIRTALEAQGLVDDTLVIFLSDNGGPTKELTSSNAPLRDGKGSMYEGGLRVPFFVTWPSRILAGQVCTEIVSSLDILPTLARAANADIPDTAEGFDLLPLLNDPSAKLPERTLYWRQGGRAAFRSGAWKIVAPQRRAEDRRWELYNIDSDIGESRDLATHYPERLSQLQSAWETRNAQMREPLFQ